MKRDGYQWTEEELKWFKERGCEWVKPEMDLGDFVLWDSRTVHYGATPLEQKKRFAICMCLFPAHPQNSAHCPGHLLHAGSEYDPGAKGAQG